MDLILTNPITIGTTPPVHLIHSHSPSTGNTAVSTVQYGQNGFSKSILFQCLPQHKQFGFIKIQTVPLAQIKVKLCSTLAPINVFRASKRIEPGIVVLRLTTMLVEAIAASNTTFVMRQLRALAAGGCPTTLFMGFSYHVQSSFWVVLDIYLTHLDHCTTPAPEILIFFKTHAFLPAAAGPLALLVVCTTTVRVYRRKLLAWGKRGTATLCWLLFEHTTSLYVGNGVPQGRSK